jgi:hypothetical protein
MARLLNGLVDVLFGKPSLLEGCGEVGVLVFFPD